MVPRKALASATGGLLLLAALLTSAPSAEAKCISEDAVENFFLGIVQADAPGVTELPQKDSCCQSDICGLPCPLDPPKPNDGFGIAVIILAVIFVLIGIGTYFLVKGQSVNFFVAGRSLPLPVIVMTLASQSIDANALLGNATLSYRYHFWDGAVLPLGLGLSLILNSIFLAKKMNEEFVLTLPDVYGKKYGKLPELFASLATCISFLCLLAGNLVGMGVIVSYLFDISEEGGIAIATFLTLAYTACGGLFSVAYTDVIQSAIGMTGCLVCAFWFIANEDNTHPPASIGFPKANSAFVEGPDNLATNKSVGMYMYPDNIGDGGICDMYKGVPCENNAGACCYNTDLHCPNDDNCKADNGAYPFGDKRYYDDQMTNPWSLSPFPNAILFNWATIFVLGFGNLAALDFQARCMAAKTPTIAVAGCAIAGCLTFFVGIPFASLGAITRYYYGLDSPYATFTADTCSGILDLPQCAAWSPDSNAFLYLLTQQAPQFLGGWCLIGIVAASMSTSDGAILALGTVFSHNIVRVTSGIMGMKNVINDSNLLMIARISTVPFALIAMAIGQAYKSDHSAGATGYLLIVAFDIALASCVVSLFGAFYTKNPSANASLFSIICGSLTRVILEFALKKDGFLLAPYGKDEFLDYGAPKSDLFPGFFDVPKDLHWDKTDTKQCSQSRFEDWTGMDSLISPVVSLLVFTVFQLLESDGKRVLNFLPDLMTPYEKEVAEEKPVAEVEAAEAI